MQRVFQIVITAVVLSIACATEAAPPVAARVETTLSTTAGRIRQFAFDGDRDSFFASAQNAGPADAFTLVLDEPVSLKSVAVVTGRPDGTDRLDSGVLEISEDGKTFEKVAEFDHGRAQSSPSATKVHAIRIRPTAELNHSLAILEITIDSNPAVAVFGYPVEFIVDVTDAPELKEWAEKVARECERVYPMINEELKGDGFQPPYLVNLRITTSYRGVAAASGSRITGSVRYFKEHPDDVGAMIHETAHVVQHYRGRRNPSWLVEGVADYVRFFKYEPGKIGPINAERAHYNRSYRVTAAFLAYVSEKYDKELVLKLNRLMRAGQYQEQTFQDLTGKTLPELDEEWRATLSE